MAILIPVVKDFSGKDDQLVINKYFLSAVCLVAALGGLLFGFDLVIISGAMPFFTQTFRLSGIQQGFAVGCINLGAALGAILAGYLSDLFGRRKFLIVCALLFVFTGLGTGWAASFPIFVAFRMLSGVAMGAAALVSPMYIAEIAPGKYRGRLVAFYQLAIVTGLLLAYLSNYALLTTGINNWRWMFSSQAVPALLFFIGLLFVPESPRWLVKRRMTSAAGSVLAKIGGRSYAGIELEAIEKSFSSEIKERVRDVLQKRILPILGIGTMLAVFSQIVGENSVMSYAPEIFTETGVATQSAFRQSVLIGVVFFLFTFIAIGTVDKIGRRKLLLFGAALLCLSLCGVSACFALHLTSGYWVLSFVLAFIATFSATLGPVTWIMLSEIFPNRVRGNAMGISTFALWLANFFTTGTFPLMREHFGMAITFGIHALICFLLFVFAWKKIPETKGRSLEEIEAILVKKIN